MIDRRKLLRCSGAIGLAFVAVSIVASAQTSQTKAPAQAKVKKSSDSAKISLSPRFVPGQTFRYEMEVETTTDTSRSGIASDPQGPSSLVINWSATVRIDLLAADPSRSGGIRLRTTYEKSAATVRSDTFDPAATETAAQYHKLEGKVVEFLLDPGGKVESIAGLDEISGSEKAAQSARDWVAQLSAGAGAPSGGVSIGQGWSSEQPASTLPIAGMIWHTDSQYLRNESCRSPNPDLPAPAAGAAAPAPDSQSAQDCAVILAKLSLVRSKASRDLTPPELRQNGVESSGKWSGSGESLLYVSLASGLVVSATQTGTEEMDVTLTSNHDTSMRYAGTISSRSHVALIQDGDGRN